MSAQAILEGKWEEILTHSHELSGQTVRLTIVHPNAFGFGQASGDQLLAEYHALVDIELDSGLTKAQAARLDEIETRLDDREEQSPNVQALYQRLDEGNNKLDHILAMLGPGTEKP